ncbi:hypothetical protein D3C85_1105320 [compost metagenome]
MPIDRISRCRSGSHDLFLAIHDLAQLEFIRGVIRTCRHVVLVVDILENDTRFAIVWQGARIHIDRKFMPERPITLDRECFLGCRRLQSLFRNRPCLIPTVDVGTVFAPTSRHGHVIHPNVRFVGDQADLSRCCHCRRLKHRAIVIKGVVIQFRKQFGPVLVYSERMILLPKVFSTRIIGQERERRR